MRIHRIILRVSDLETSVGFWQGKVGLELAGKGGGFAFLDGGGVHLVLNQIDEVPDDSSLTEIVFQVDDVRAAFDELSGRDVRFEVELRPVTSDGNHELLAAHFRDPDGHLASVTGWV
ncbi:MAG: VOC family protein [Actinomycetota bacterium]